MGAHVVGVDVDARIIRAVEVKNPAKSSRTIVRVHSIPLPEGAVRGGEVVEPGTVSDALRALWASAKFSTKNVALGFGGAKAFARDVQLPYAPLDRLREQLPFTVQEMIPLPVAEALLDFYPAAEDLTEGGPVIRGILVAAQKDAVRALVGAVMKAKLTPVAVDLGPFGMVRAVEPVGIATESVMVVGIGASSSSIVVSEAGVPRFVRMLSIGGDDITAGVASRLQISTSQAEQVKAHYGIVTANTNPADRTPIEAIYAASWDLLAGIRDTLAYFTTAHKTARVDRIAIVGDGTRFPGFDSTLAELAKLPVGRASIGRAAALSKSIEGDGRNLDEYVTALGLALGVTR